MCYAFIIAIALIPMADIKVTGVYMGVVALGNVVEVVYQAVSGQLSAADLPNVEIRVASTILFGIYLVISTKVLVANIMERLKEIEAEKQRTAELMEQVLSASEQITMNIGTLSDKMGVLENTTGQTMSPPRPVCCR